MNGPTSFQFGRLLVVMGGVLVAAGLIVMASSKFSNFGLGRLPGDIAFRGKNFQFYFPIVTCAIVSCLLTAILWIISFLTRK